MENITKLKSGLKLLTAYYMDKSKIIDFCKLHDLKNYHIDKHGFINVNGDVDILLTTKSLEYIKFGKITGDFDVSWSALASAEGFPTSVGGIIYATYCYLDKSSANFDIIYRCECENMEFDDGFMIDYMAYYKNRKRIETISSILYE